MAVLSVETKKISELDAALAVNGTDNFIVDTAANGTRKATFSAILASLKSELNVPTSANTLLSNESVSTTYENETAKVAASSLAYDLSARLTVAERERNCIYGVLPHGIEWTLTNLLAKIRAEKFSDFAIGDYIVENSNKWMVAAKNYWTENELTTFTPHVVLMMESGASNYSYNSTATNSGGFNNSALATTLTTTFYNSLSSALRAACLEVNSYESTKGGMSKYKRKIKLPSTKQTVSETVNSSCPSYEQFPLCRSLHFLNASGFWLIDADDANAANFLYYSPMYKSARTTSATTSSIPIRPILAIG